MKNKSKISTFAMSSLVTFCAFAQQNVQAQSFSLNQVNEHILKIRRLKTEINSTKLDSESSEKIILLEALRHSNSYVQSLTEYLIRDYEDGGVDAYTLNLVHEFLRYQISLSEKIEQQPISSRSMQIIKAIHLINIKKVDDLFFSNKGLRGIYKDQLNTIPLGLAKWKTIVSTHLTKSYIDALNESVKENFYPVEKLMTKYLTDELEALLNSLKGSSLYKDLENNKMWSDTLLTNKFWTEFSDNANEKVGAIATGASAAFGAVAGNIAWREGYLKEDKNLLDYIKKTVRPFDLLMEKKAYKFTDLTIPGHWGHIGVYLGTKKQLIEMGMWNSKYIDPFRENIERGKTIFQVRRTGLVFDALDDFMNLDEMAILRVQGQADKPASELNLVFEYLGAQLGKTYDFSFDAMTEETITCTEIVAFSYGPIKWPMDYIVGRYSITPNNMAELALFTNSPLQTIAYVTGDKEGTHYRSEAEFGKTLEYKAFGSRYKKEATECERKTYRHNRSSIRFKYVCNPVYTENIYLN